MRLLGFQDDGDQRAAVLMVADLEDAVMELDMTGAPVIVFRHAGTDRINVVYRRGDGNIGWIDPGAEPGKSLRAAE